MQHIRAARRESLSAGEQAIYDAGLVELDAEEKLLWEDANLDLLRRLKAEVERLEAAHAQLQVKSQRFDLEQQNAELERTILTKLTGI